MKHIFKHSYQARTIHIDSEYHETHRMFVCVSRPILFARYTLRRRYRGFKLPQLKEYVKSAKEKQDEFDGLRVEEMRDLVNKPTDIDRRRNDGSKVHHEVVSKQGMRDLHVRLVCIRVRV